MFPHNSVKYKYDITYNSLWYSIRLGNFQLKKNSRENVLRFFRRSVCFLAYTSLLSLPLHWHFISWDRYIIGHCLSLRFKFSKNTYWRFFFHSRKSSRTGPNLYQKENTRNSFSISRYIVIVLMKKSCC